MMVFRSCLESTQTIELHFQESALLEETDPHRKESAWQVLAVDQSGVLGLTYWIRVDARYNILTEMDAVNIK